MKRIYFISGNEVHSRDNCIYKCERDLFEEKFNCTPNPLIEKSLKFLLDKIHFIAAAIDPHMWAHNYLQQV